MNEELMNCEPMAFLAACINNRVIQIRDVEEIEAFNGPDFLKISYPKFTLSIGERKQLRSLVEKEFSLIYGKTPEIKQTEV